MQDLFESSRINTLELKNRFVRSATWEGMAKDDGAVTPQLIQTLVDLAKGEVGLIIAGHAYVHPRGKASPWQLGIYKDELLDGLKELTSSVHSAGGKVVAQLAHAGHFTSEELTGGPPMVASNFDGLSDSPREEFSKHDLDELVQAFARAAGRAKEAGFDAIQIHSAHGYLLSQFLSPAFNRRDDEYGGDIANRARLHLEILRAIRREVGDDYPVLIKINSRDFDGEGLSLDESVYVTKLLADAGLDAVELSGGLLTGGKWSPSRPGINSREKEAYFAEHAARFKQEMNLPLILVGGIRSLEKAGDVVRREIADYVSLSRPLIREPDLVKRWKEGDDRPAECVSDNKCFKPAMQGEGIYCSSKVEGES